MSVFSHVTPESFQAQIEQAAADEGWDLDDPDFVAAIESIQALMWLEAEGFIECEIDSEGTIRMFPQSS